MAVRALALLAVVLGLAACGTAGSETSGPSSPATSSPAATPTVTSTTTTTDSSSRSPGPPGGDQAALREGDSVFAGLMLSALARDQPTVAFSAFSISEALAMTYAGARGQTAAQIATALHFRLPPARLGLALKAVAEALDAQQGPHLTIDDANSLYGQRGMAFEPAFLTELQRDYGADMRLVDFLHDPVGAATTINHWVTAQTHGRITNLLSPGDVTQLTRLVLVNAIYLNAKWVSPFHKQNTHPAPFYAPGGTMQVATMEQAGTFGYLRGRGYRALELPYLGGSLAFDVLLPDPGELSNMVARVAAQGPLALLAGLRPQFLQVQMPKLLLRTRVELTPALSALGMPVAFVPGRANLSGIAGPPGDLFISKVLHEAYIRVDEAGTEAAAATGVVIAPTAVLAPPKITFDIDRPFVFLVRDTKTGAILFLGEVSQP
jgi:serpin B